MKELLANSLSKIHLSFDLWTSASGLPILNIYTHYLDQSLQLYHPLLALKYIKGTYTSEAITSVITAIVIKYKITEKIGVYIANNAISNNVTYCTGAQELRNYKAERGRRVTPYNRTA